MKTFAKMAALAAVPFALAACGGASDTQTGAETDASETTTDLESGSMDSGMDGATGTTGTTGMDGATGTTTGGTTTGGTTTGGTTTGTTTGGMTGTTTGGAMGTTGGTSSTGNSQGGGSSMPDQPPPN